MKHKLIRLSLLLVMILFAGIVLLAGAMQTPWGKNRIRGLIISFAKENNIELQVSKVSGDFPFEYTLSDVVFPLDEKNELTIASLEIKINLFSLLKRHLSIKSLRGEDLAIRPRSATAPPALLTKQDGSGWIEPPLRINIRSFTLTRLHLDCQGKGASDISVSGKALIAKNGRRIFLRARATRESFKKSYIKIEALALKNNRSLRLYLDGNLETAKALPCTDLGAALSGKIALNGPWDTYFGIEGSAPIGVTITAKLFDFTKVPNDLSPILALPAEIKAKGQLTASELSLEKIKFKNGFLFATGSALFSNRGVLQKMELSGTTEDLSHFYPKLGGILSYNLCAGQNGDTLDYESKLSAPLIQMGNERFENMSLFISGQAGAKQIQGALTANGSYQDMPLSLQSKLDWDYHTHIEVKEAALAFKENTFKAGFTFGEQTLGGTIQGHLKNESFFGISFKEANCMGKLAGGNGSFSIDLQEPAFQDILAQKITAQLSLTNILTKIDGSIELYAANVQYQDERFDQITLKTANIYGVHPFSMQLQGSRSKPCFLKADGNWEYAARALSFDIASLSGHCFEKPFSSQGNIALSLTPGALTLSNLRLAFEEGFLYANIIYIKPSIEAHIQAKNFPLEAAAFLPWEIIASGSADLQMDVVLRDKKTEGALELIINEAQMAALEAGEQLNARGVLFAKIENNTLVADANFIVREAELFTLKASLPLQGGKYALHTQKPISASLAFNGRVEEFLDFFDMGYHRIEGALKAELSLSNTLQNPKIDGTLTMDEGVYENYYTGTYLEEIKANLQAQNRKIKVVSFEAKDPTGGTLQMQGDILASPLLPFTLQAELSDLSVVNTDFVKTKADGTIKFSGNIHGATAKGALTIAESDLSIPNKLSVQIPSLNIEFSNRPPKKSIKDEIVKSPILYPVNLDITVATKNQIYIIGRGLDSTWKGNFHVGGTIAGLKPAGTLELIRGSYFFSGRYFDLTEGSVTFSGMEKTLPSINLSGKVDVGGHVIFARLKGALNNPALSFDSIPALPQSSIFSYLLFGKEIGEISGMQAMILSATLASFTDAPSLMEITRKTLGVDRFNIIATPAVETDDPDRVALQIGKYLTHGILVSISQGLEQGSTNAIVDVDLAHGFVFGAQTQQEQEQGKFALKWSHSY